MEAVVWGRSPCVRTALARMSTGNADSANRKSGFMSNENLIDVELLDRDLKLLKSHVFSDQLSKEALRDVERIRGKYRVPAHHSDRKKDLNPEKSITWTRHLQENTSSFSPVAGPLRPVCSTRLSATSNFNADHHPFQKTSSSVLIPRINVSNYDTLLNKSCNAPSTTETVLKPSYGNAGLEMDPIAIENCSIADVSTSPGCNIEQSVTYQDINDSEPYLGSKDSQLAEECASLLNKYEGSGATSLQVGNLIEGNLHCNLISEKPVVSRYQESTEIKELLMKYTAACPNHSQKQTDMESSVSVNLLQSSTETLDIQQSSVTMKCEYEVKSSYDKHPSLIVSDEESDFVHKEIIFGHELIQNMEADINCDKNGFVLGNGVDLDLTADRDINYHENLDRSDSGISTLPPSGLSPVLSIPSARQRLSRRQSSKCSLVSMSSVDTSFSEDLSDFDDDTLPSFTVGETVYKKESMWGKIRKVVKWSPFMQSYRKKYPWIQLAGHPGGFKPGCNGTIFKKTCKLEIGNMQKLMQDVLRSYVPEYKGEMVEDGDTFIEMQDLLCEFDCPYVMDCKMGTRTYLEDEVKKAGKPRQDLYQKMVSIDPSEPTDDENNNEAVTKQRYMIWREELSSTASLGFRIEGIKRGSCDPDRDFKKVRTKEDVGRLFHKFTSGRQDVVDKFVQRLHAIKATLLSSSFFKAHEVVGSSLLFVYDHTGKTGVWLIDFGKTVLLPENISVDHNSEWILGNHEDGYLIGLENLVEVMSTCTSSTACEGEL